MILQRLKKLKVTLESRQDNTNTNASSSRSLASSTVNNQSLENRTRVILNEAAAGAEYSHSKSYDSTNLDDIFDDIDGNEDEDSSMDDDDEDTVHQDQKTDVNQLSVKPETINSDHLQEQMLP